MRRIRGSPQSRPSRVVLHIGAPLVGTSYLREVLARNRRKLTRYGVLYPSSHVGVAGHRDAVLDVLDLTTPGVGRPTGAWDRLAQAVRDWRRGTVVVSHELLADADADQVHRIVSTFAGVEVHVVYVARDLARQLPLAWQEWVRNGGTATFEGYVDKVVERDSHRLARVFWRSHDVADVLGRWAEVVAPDHIHVVTAPGVPDELPVLWQRFADVLEVDAARFRLPAAQEPTLDALAATEALRRLNVAGSRRLPQDLLAVVGGPAPAMASTHASWVEAEGHRAVDAVKRGGYAVVGDVTELRSDPRVLTDEPARTVPTSEAVAAAQTEILAALLDS